MEATPNQESNMNTATIPVAASVLVTGIDTMGLQGREVEPPAECKGQVGYVVEYLDTEDAYDEPISFYNVLVPGLGIFTFADYELHYTAA
jgi:hypothetical protein